MKRTSCVFALIFLAPNFADMSVAEDVEMTKVHRDIVFAKQGDQELKLDLYLPDGETKPPLVVWIHGGGWRGGSKNKPPIRKVTECGYALASISYRFTNQAIFPAQIHDCKGAVRWLRAAADEYGYDAKWIAVAGSSAGGHLALLLGTSGGDQELEGEVGGNLQHSSRVQAVIDYYGPSDFVLRAQTQRERAYTTKSGSFAMLGGLVNGKVDGRLEKIASPARYVDACDPPLLVFHGTDDDVVLMDQSEHIVQVYQQAGLEAELVKVDGAGHGGAKFFWGEHFDVALQFLEKHAPQRP